ncbi:MAG: cation:proton antiporter [archaeon]|nr:cation:proton antiporter [archaeon]
MDLKDTLLVLTVIFVLIKIAAALFDRFGIPGLVGEILVGILLASIMVGDYSIAEYLKIYSVNGGKREFYLIDTLANLGVIFLLFSIGLETRIKDLLSVGRVSLLVAVSGVILPFALGYTYIYFLGDGNIYHATFMGAAMVATSVGITARVIKDNNFTNTKEARIIISADVMDDILGMIVLAIVTGMTKSDTLDIGHVFIVTFEALAFVGVIMLLSLSVIPKIRKLLESHKFGVCVKDSFMSTKSTLIISVAVCLGLALLAEIIGLAAIIGAFLAGILFSECSSVESLRSKIESVNVLLVSFFFVFVGLQIDVSKVTLEIIPTALFVIALAIIGKYVGCGLGVKIGDRSIDGQSMNIVGLGMIPRGEVGIIVATLGLNTVVNGSTAISPELYTIVVLMSVATTIIIPPMLLAAFRKKYGVRLSSKS